MMATEESSSSPPPPPPPPHHHPFSPSLSRKRSANDNDDLPSTSGNWQDFCRKGTLFKTFLNDTWTKVLVVTNSGNDKSLTSSSHWNDTTSLDEEDDKDKDEELVQQSTMRHKM